MVQNPQMATTVPEDSSTVPSSAASIMDSLTDGSGYREEGRKTAKTTAVDDVVATGTATATAILTRSS